MKENRSHKYSLLFSENLWILLSCQVLGAVAQCEHGLEKSCVWVHDPKTYLHWQLKRDSQDLFVELSKCIHPACGIGIIQTSWLSPRDNEVYTTLHYKIYGTSEIYLRLYMELEDSQIPITLYSKNGNYAHTFPDSWTAIDVRIPPTNVRYKLLLKGYVTYSEAMLAVKDIGLDGSIILTSTSSSSTSTSTSSTRNTRSSTSTTTTIATVPENENDIENQIEKEEQEEEEELTANDDDDYFPNDFDDDEEERRFQSLEVRSFIGEEDLTLGFTEVVEPQICMYK